MSNTGTASADGVASSSSAPDLVGIVEVNALFAAIVSSSEDAIVSKDLNGIVTSWNAAAERIYGWPADEIVGKSKALVIPPDMPDELPSILARVKAGERVEHYQTRRIRKDGTIIDVDISVSPVHDPNGAIVGAATIVRDITERRRTERELVQRQEQIEELNARLQRQIAEAHHRIKNNLQAVTSLIEMQKVEASGGFVSVESLNGSLLQIKTIALVHDLLSHKEAFNDVDTQMLLGNLVELLAGSGITVPITLSSDSIWLPTQTATSLALVVNELISNAHKHGTLGEEGNNLLGRPPSNDGVSIRFWQHESSFILEVDDSGPGFPMGFDVNQHANLGLALVQSLVENDLRGQLTFGMASSSFGASLAGEPGGGRVRIEFSAPDRTQL